MKEKVADLLLPWYDANARKLPWRGIHDAYRTWVSETMLQQTRVETVIPYYERFLRRFPDVAALAEAPEEDVLKLWEGLGYYRRAHNLQQGAKQVVNEYGGKLPATAEELIRIHGIGPYTAGAIASIAFDQPVPAVDGNVIRVTSRLRGIRENVGIPSVRRRVEEEAAANVPAKRPGDFNQAVMDLGATICMPGTPGCERCPLQAICDAWEAGDMEELPVLPRKNPPKLLTWDVCLIYRGDAVLMRQRTETMLQGLWVFPMLEGHHTLKELPARVRRTCGVRAGQAVLMGEGRHVFTHQIWQMRIHAMDALDDSAAEGWRYVNRSDLEQLPVPTAMKAAVQLLWRR